MQSPQSPSPQIAQSLLSPQSSQSPKLQESLESVILDNFNSNIVEHINTSSSITIPASGAPNDPSIPKTDKPVYGIINNPPSESSGSSGSSGSSLSILDYVFQYSYFISFIGAIALAISEVVGFNPLSYMSEKILMAINIIIGVSGFVSLFAWFNTPVWYIDTSIINPNNIATKNNLPFLS